jgi:hypothetical protein
MNSKVTYCMIIPSIKANFKIMELKHDFWVDFSFYYYFIVNPKQFCDEDIYGTNIFVPKVINVVFLAQNIVSSKLSTTLFFFTLL